MLPPWLAQRFPADNPAAALLNLLHLAGFAVTATTVREAVAAHPSYPAVSFAALGDILTGWGLDSLPLRIGPEELAHVRLPALVLLADDGGTYGVVYEATATTVRYLHPRTGWHNDSLAQFAARWPGAALLVDPGDVHEEPDYARKREAETVRRRLDAAQRKVELVPGLLSADECDYLLGLAAPRFAPSAVIGADGVRTHAGRTSHTAKLFLPGEARLEAVCDRLAGRLGVPVRYCEYFQCVRYEAGQFYGEHLDTLDEGTPPGADEVARRGQRALTVLVYLNEDFEGGETHFPRLDRKVTPQRGAGLLFYLLDRHGKPDPDARHAGLPVFSGTKYALNVWVRTRPFREE
ncbi:MAG: hypothetical protein AVDCRST_MAG56-415 [uncultured Cytophagales bacterium]|uniref:Procollagen-proline 4-dioxygenase n=1 Tax=uncultured Cytophagales bacterium TaxID=158755 RepID=A0A6J4HFC7_9SPHI|nr:MAG: hypothetical protein AVDCRST_MAG56-415 [uncultured Cytophagales bacterium]